MDMYSLMWDDAVRDKNAETLDLARTAALADADTLVGALVFQAVDASDLGHRLALVEGHLQAIAGKRDYPVEELTADLTRRWSLLAEARQEKVKQASLTRQVTARQEAAMDKAVAQLAALAARENPLVPMTECLRVASEAVQKHADAFPLAYESWGGTGDGPITDRAKNWKPPGMSGGSGPGATDPGSQGGSSTFDEVHQRLDGLESRIPGASSPVGPAGPSGPTTASLDPVAAGIFRRLKDWWHGGPDGEQSAPAPHHELGPHEAPPYHGPYGGELGHGAAPVSSAAPASTPPIPRHDPSGWQDGSASRHVEDAADAASQRAHDEAGRRAHDEIMRRLDNDQAEMNRKWDTPAHERFVTPTQRQEDNDRRMDHLERRLDQAGAPKYNPAPIQHSLFH
ncbi:hypothetical protein [Streptomyces sp. NPDC088752]|uniref:hypothetical protein n=1 Tax=Streptomyces sp. NPDC088752 TaxID=3154963 RepID=UPI0034391A9C